MRTLFVILLLALSFTSIASAQSKPVVVVELFTSEGCSSCPPADEILRQLQEKGSPTMDFVLLGEHVDYWDGLGWHDRFSSSQFTARQQDYALKLRIQSPYTPQMVVDGRTELVGNDGDSLRKALLDASSRAKPLTLALQWNPASQTVSISGQGSAGGDLYVAITEDGLETKVQSGENGGTILHHDAVVHKLTSVGGVQGAFKKDVEMKLAKPWNPAHLRVAAFVQDRKTGQIVGAASIRAQ